MRTIKVDPNLIEVPTFDSASSAISAEMRTARAERSAIESPLLAGSYINDFLITDDMISLHLSNGSSCDLAVANGRVEWEISNRVPNVRQGIDHLSDSVNLVWPSGRSRIWSAATLLESRQNFPFDKLFAGQVFVNLYFKGGGALQFIPLRNCSEESFLLYFFELEPVKIKADEGEQN